MKKITPLGQLSQEEIDAVDAALSYVENSISEMAQLADGGERYGLTLAYDRIRRYRLLFKKDKK